MKVEMTERKKNAPILNICMRLLVLEYMENVYDVH